MEISPGKMKEAKVLYEQVKESVQDDVCVENLETAIMLLKKVIHLCPLEKYKKRLVMLQDALDNAKSEEADEKESGDEEDENNDPNASSSSPSGHGNSSGDLVEPDDDVNNLANSLARQSIARVDSSSGRYVKVQGHKILRKPFEKLYDYQKDGINFLLQKFNEPVHKGCILADDMGLGKTIQSIVLLASLIEEGSISSVLIVAPNTLLSNWASEFRKWTPDVDVYKYHDQTENRRKENLRAVQRRGGVLLTTFGLLANHGPKLSSLHGDVFEWDAILLDEAHKIKNPTKTTNAVKKIPGKFKVAITGTPIMNNLSELYAIFNWIFLDQHFLNSQIEFKERFEKPINKSRQKDALPHEKSLGVIRGQQLKQIVDPYILRRTKADVFGSKSTMTNKLPTKFDFIIWIKLTEDQIKMYRDYLGMNSEMIKEADTHAGPLVKLTNLKKLCDHPLLLPVAVVNDLIERSKRKATRNSETETQRISKHNMYSDFVNENGLVDILTIDEAVLMETSAKMCVLIHLLEQLRKENHRTLVFSQSTRLLDIIQTILIDRQFKLARLDGNVKMKDRDAIVETFQKSTSINVMLLTTQVGGVGLTLTNADRVVIYDPNWNPAVDAQAIDRAYRIGQTAKDVIVYRLMTCGSVEEKIFRRQIFKGSVTRQVLSQSTEDNDPTRYFSHSQIWELFKFNHPEETMASETWKQLNEMHSSKHCPFTEKHKQFIISHDSVYNISDHSLLFSVKNKDEMDHDAAMKLDRTGGYVPINSGPEFNRNRNSYDRDDNEDNFVPNGNHYRNRIKYPNLENPTEIVPIQQLFQKKNEKKIFSDPTDVVDLIESPIKSPSPSASGGHHNLSIHSMSEPRRKLFESINEGRDGVSLNSEDDFNAGDDENDNGSDLNSFIVPDDVSVHSEHNSSANGNEESILNEVSAINLSADTGSIKSGGSKDGSPNVSKSSSMSGGSSDSGSPQNASLNVSMNASSASKSLDTSVRSDVNNESMIYRRKKRSEFIISDDEDGEEDGTNHDVSALEANNWVDYSVLRMSVGTPKDGTPRKSVHSEVVSPKVSSTSKTTTFDTSLKNDESMVRYRDKNGSDVILSDDEDGADVQDRSVDVSSASPPILEGTPNVAQPRKSILKNGTSASKSGRKSINLRASFAPSPRHNVHSKDSANETGLSFVSASEGGDNYGNETSFYLHDSFFKTPTPTKLGQSDFLDTSSTPTRTPMNDLTDEDGSNDVFVTPMSVTTRKKKESKSRNHQDSQHNSMIYDELILTDDEDDLDEENGIEKSFRRGHSINSGNASINANDESLDGLISPEL